LAPQQNLSSKRDPALVKAIARGHTWFRAAPLVSAPRLLNSTAAVNSIALSALIR
jgi:hypothetical protein